MSYFSNVINKEFIFQAVLNGDAYYGIHEFVSVSAGTTVEMLLQVGASRLIASIDIVDEAEATGIFYEGPTFSAAGTGVSLLNLNRGSANTSEATLTHTPTVSDNGLQLEKERIYTGGTMEFSADRSLKALWVLAPNTNYLLRTSNDAGAAENILTTFTLAQI